MDISKAFMNIARFINKDELVLDASFITPAFIGGADGKVSELRPSSLKGMLRFWWRALYAALYVNCSKNAGNKKLLDIENDIFGSAGDGTKSSNKSHASLVRIQILNPPQTTSSNKLLSSTNSILSYLAYGKGGTNQDQRFATYLNVNEKFKLTLSLSKSLTEEQVSQVKQAFFALIEFGGLGGKCRNGYGCIKAKTLFQEYSLKNEPQEFVTLSKKTKCYETSSSFDTWSEALNTIGQFYKDNKKQILQAKLNGEQRHPKEMFLHITKDDLGKYKGRFLTMPLKNSSFENFYKELDNSEKFNDVTANLFKVLL